MQQLTSIVAALLLPVTLAACAGIPGRPARPAPSSYGCMRAVLEEKVPAGAPDKRTHCLASGLIARYCSVSEAYLAGLGKELRDLVGAGDAEWGDWRADRAGVGCARAVADDAELAECCAARGY